MSAPPAEHVGGARVAQDVRADLVRQSDPVGVLLDHAERPYPGQPAPPGVEEHGLGIAAPPPLLRLEMGPALAREPLGGRRSARRPNGTTRSLSPFPRTRINGRPSDSTALGHVAQVQPDHLADPGPVP